jgi:hypothetical protein
MILLYVPLFGILIFLIASAVMPRRYRVEKMVTIDKPIADVMKKIGDLNFYALWNPWQQADPSSLKTITGTPGAIGHKYAWHGKKTGEGSLTITKVSDSYIHFDLEFLKPWKSHANDDWFFEQRESGETKVTWKNSGDLPWPFARIMGPVINKNLNHQFQKGLSNLKKICEEE